MNPGCRGGGGGGEKYNVFNLNIKFGKQKRIKFNNKLITK
jgi:hypothetical protein